MSDQAIPRVFISYASERREVAEDIAAVLQVEHYQVFFDKDALRAGAAYDQTIREEIWRCRLFVVLISPEMFKEQSYVLTEVQLAKDAWPSPVGHVLPVMIAQIDRRQLPAYLRRLTPLHVEGDMAAEVAAEVHMRLRGAATPGVTSALPEVGPRQVDAYRALWSLTGLLPKWPRDKTVSYQQLAELSRSLRDWYFGAAGGLFLTSRAYSRYAELQDALQAPPANSGLGPISDEDYDEVRGLCSVLRRQMALDVGTRV
jgi:hypothetical protein